MAEMIEDDNLSENRLDSAEDDCNASAGEDILQKALRSVDSKLVHNGTAPQVSTPPAVRFKSPTALQKAKPVLTVTQLMAGLVNGQIRLTSPNATTADQKQMPITEILKMAAANQNQVESKTKMTATNENEAESKTKMASADQNQVESKTNESAKGLDDDEPLSSVKKRLPLKLRRNPSRKKKNVTGPKKFVLEYTDLTEPPEGYMTVFMPVKQTSGDSRPILVPKSMGRLPKIGGTAKIPDIEEPVEEEEVEKREEVLAAESESFCDSCCVLYSSADASSHVSCVKKRRERTQRKQYGEPIDQCPDANGADAEDMDEDLDDDRDEDFVMEVDDDDDEDDDYRPGPSRRKIKSEKTDDESNESQTLCTVCNQPFTNQKDHENCSKSSRSKNKSPSKRAAKCSDSKEIPKCSVCNKPYTSFKEHMACSGAGVQNERKDGQIRAAEIQRTKRRRRVHRFLKLNFTLNPKIIEPPEIEYVGSHMIKDDEDLLEENFIFGDDRPPLGLTCYHCAEPFEDDIAAYNHYTQTRCGPKYIGKVLFRSKNRAENRPNNVMVEKSQKSDLPKAGQRLKRHYFKSFQEKIVEEDGTAKRDHICTACGESFTNEDAVKEHYSKEHRWRCKLCGDIYVHMKGVQLHYNRSHGKSYCLLCHVLFDSAAELQVHMRSHQKRLCDLCGQVLANKHHYNKHMLKQHNVANAEPLHSQMVKTKPQPRGLCEICGKEYSWPFLKSKHMASHFNPKPPKLKKTKEEEEEGELDDVPDKKNKDILYPFRCEICSRGFQRVFYFNQHLERHAKGLACDRCGLFFALHVDKEKHISECRDNICSLCGEQCITKEALKRHKQIHPCREVCKVCSREFSTKFMLKNHLLTHKQYQCKVCSKRFPSVEHVNKHKCFGEKFQCKICFEKFASIRMCRQHAKNEHNRDGMDLFTKKRIEFDIPEEESPMSMPMPMRMPANTTMTMAPMPGPSHVTPLAPGAPLPPGQPSMTAQEVSQALMTLHDFPMPGYSPMPLNMARDNCQRDPNQLCRDPNSYPGKLTPSGFPTHPPPSYPGSYF